MVFKELLESKYGVSVFAFSWQPAGLLTPLAIFCFRCAPHLQRSVRCTKTALSYGYNIFSDLYLYYIGPYCMAQDKAMVSDLGAAF